MTDQQVRLFLHRIYNKVYRERRRADPERQARFLAHQRIYERSRRPRKRTSAKLKYHGTEVEPTAFIM